MPQAAVRGDDLFRSRGYGIGFIVKTHLDFTMGVYAAPHAMNSLKARLFINIIMKADSGGHLILHFHIICYPFLN